MSNHWKDNILRFGRTFILAIALLCFLIGYFIGFMLEQLIPLSQCNNLIALSLGAFCSFVGFVGSAVYLLKLSSKQDESASVSLAMNKIKR